MNFILNFHGIGEPGREYEYGEHPYWIDATRFCEVLDLVAKLPQTVEITFDDGNASDYAIAVPELRRRQIKARFFVLAGKLDKPAALTRDEVRAIDADSLFSIGSHGLTHRIWPDLSEVERTEEVEQSRAILSELCTRPIDEAGLPFGRYDRATMKALAKAGYTRVYSSDGGPRLTGLMPIPRMSVRNDMTLSEIESAITNHGAMARIKAELRSSIKARA